MEQGENIGHGVMLSFMSTMVNMDLSYIQISGYTSCRNGLERMKNNVDRWIKIRED